VAAKKKTACPAISMRVNGEEHATKAGQQRTNRWGPGEVPWKTAW
jgi:hypothetical protein